MSGSTNVVPQNSNNRDVGSGYDPIGQQAVAARASNIQTGGNGYNYGDMMVRLDDGADATLGALADAAYTGSGGASLVSLLKGLYNKFNLSALQGVVSSTGNSATIAATDYSLTFSQRVNHIIIQNNTTSSVMWECDQTASAGSPLLVSGQTLFLDIQCTVVHLYTANVQNVNGTAAGNIVVRGWL